MEAVMRLRRPSSRHLPLIPRLPALLACAGLAACGSGTSGGLETQVRDSAGVAIVETPDHPARGAGGWALDQQPFLSIGTFDGDSLYQLYRISGGIRLSDGRIVLSDDGSLQLRMFGPDGAFLRAWGREGEGPGEFLAVEVMGVVGGDTLVVVDGRLRRISLFHPERGFLEQYSVDERAGHVLFANGMFGDGSIVFGGELTFGPGGDTPENGINRSEARYRSARRDGSFGATFGSVPGAEMFMQAQSGGGEIHVSAVSIPYGRSPAAHARGEILYVGSGDTYEILGFGPDGRLDRIIRVLQPPPPVTSQDVERFIEGEVAALEDPSRAPATRNLLNDIPTPATMPAYRAFTVDSEGFLWVEDFRRPWERLRNWTVFDGEGRPRTRLSLPSGNRLLDIGRDYVMAVFEDPLGVQYLRLFALSRGE